MAGTPIERIERSRSAVVCNLVCVCARDGRVDDRILGLVQNGAHCRDAAARLVPSRLHLILRSVRVRLAGLDRLIDFCALRFKLGPVSQPTLPP
jgi:hypothetical protein